MPKSIINLNDIPKSVINLNDRGEHQGYQALFFSNGRVPVRRGTYKRNIPVSYYEYHGLQRVIFYIR